jgi:cyanophycinase
VLTSFVKVWLRDFSILVVFLVAMTASAQDFVERFEDWPLDLKIGGTLGFAREPVIPSRLVELVVGKASRSVLVLTNGNSAEKVHESFQQLGELKTADVNSDVELESSIRIVFWIDDRSPEQIPAKTKERIANFLSNILRNGGSVFVCGSHAELVGYSFIQQSPNHDSRVDRGMNLLPDCVLQFELPPTQEGEKSFLSNLTHHPKCVGVGLEAGTWMLLQNRKIRVVGDGFGKFLLAPGTYPSTRVHSIRDTAPKVKELDKVLVDLTQWRREAIDRTLPPFPPLETVQPIVTNGHLLIVGGGGLPSGLMDRFVELAGGTDNAKLVYVPCEEDDQVAEKQSTVEMWKRMGVKNATYIHTKDRKQANEDNSFLEPLVEATGIWFGGGRQWNLADSYYGTKAHRLMKQCVERGGVIGGSSAGASIQAAYLARATPIENFQIMAPGYERGGLGFLQGVAIDQHFSQRNRLPDMTQLVKKYPQLLGIGIDETTAIEVSGSTAIVSGKGSVYFFDGTKRSEDDSPSFVKLREGERYDLKQRAPIQE